MLLPGNLVPEGTSWDERQDLPHFISFQREKIFARTSPPPLALNRQSSPTRSRVVSHALFLRAAREATVGK